MVLDRRTGATTIGRFPDLIGHLREGDVLALNETRVIPARLFAERPETGGKIEILLVRPGDDGAWWAMARPGRSLQPGRTVRIVPGGELLTVRAAEGGLYGLSLASGAEPWTELPPANGPLPPPPYIHRPPTRTAMARPTPELPHRAPRPPRPGARW